MSEWCGCQQLQAGSIGVSQFLDLSIPVNMIFHEFFMKKCRHKNNPTLSKEKRKNSHVIFCFELIEVTECNFIILRCIYRQKDSGFFRLVANRISQKNGWQSCMLHHRCGSSQQPAKPRFVFMTSKCLQLTVEVTARFEKPRHTIGGAR